MFKLFTIGYEGASIEDFVGTLQSMGVDLLLDVRELPISRRAGFSKRSLQQHLADAGIDYQHERSLGSPKPVRDELKRTGNYETFFRKFDIHLRSQQETLDRLTTDLRGSVALMCFERDYRECHRSAVARELGNLAGLKPVHIGVQGNEQRKTYKAAV